MKKQEKKSLKLLWILLAALLVIGAVAAALLLSGVFGGQDQEAQETQPVQVEEPKLYWNVSRKQYVSKGVQGTTGRMPYSDGYYHIKMAVDGEQITVKVADMLIANLIDFQEVMGLEFDEEGICVGVLSVEETIGGRVAAKRWPVESFENGKMVCNTSVKYKGISVTFEVDENTQYWQVGDFEPMVGVKTVPTVGDQVIVIEDAQGKVAQVFVEPFVKPGDVYWNINRMYDSTTRMTTREPDMFGTYTYEFVLNGELVTLQTKVKDLADYIDRHASQCMGFNFDENGFIVEVLNAGNVVCGGGLTANRAVVTDIKGDDLTILYSGKTIEGTISRECKIFDVSGKALTMGRAIDKVEVGDRVTLLRDRRDQYCVIFVTSHAVTDPVYWVSERNDVWDRTNWVTKRQPAADGWYYIKLAGEGGEIVGKTRDAELVNEIDSYVCWAVEMNGDEIVGISDANNRYGGGTFGLFYKVDKLEGNSITASNDTKTITGTLADDCKVYIVSNNETNKGVETTVQEGDTIYGFKGLDGKIVHLFVTSRPKNGRIYWNVSRFADSKNTTTTRIPDATGRYWFETVVDGKTQWLWTYDKKIATAYDKVISRARGLDVSASGEILKVVAPNSYLNYQGIDPYAGWSTVKSISGGVITTASGKNTYQFSLAYGCKIYDVSSGYRNYRGEPTTIREGDQVVAMVNKDKQAVIVYVCGGRKLEFNTNVTTCDCKSGVTWVAWDGVRELGPGHYYLTKDAVAPEGGYVINNATVHLRLNGHTISGTTRVFDIKGNGILNICDHNTRGTIQGMGIDKDSGGVIRLGSTTGRLGLYNVNVKNVGGAQCTMDNGGVISVSGFATLSGVSVTGGSVNRKGGAVAVMPNGHLRIFGGTLSGGSAKLEGGNLVITGNAYLKDVTIVGGTAPGGGNVAITAKDKSVTIEGGRIFSEDGQGVLVNSGTVTLSGAADISQSSVYNLMLAKDAMLSVGKLSESAKVGITMANPGVFAKNAPSAVPFTSDNDDLFIVQNGKTLSLKCSHNHCVCGGHVENHTCEETGYVRLTQAMFDNATDSTAPVKKSGVNYVVTPGAYYLAESITIPAQIVISDELTLCANGFTLEVTGNRAFALNGAKLVLTDCGTTGRIQGGTATHAGTILLQGSAGSDQGDPSYVDIYGVTVAGGTTTNTSSGQGANLYIWKGELNAYGAKLEGGKAVGSGGNIIVNKGQSLNIHGGSVTNGTAPRGKGIYVVGDAKVSLSGTVQVEDIAWTDSSPLDVANLNGDSQVGLTLKAPGVFAVNAATDLHACFLVGAGVNVVYDSDAKTLSYRPEHFHCLCAGALEHTCTELPYVKLTQADFDNATADSNPVKRSGSNFNLAAGNYYLAENIDLSGQIILQGRATQVKLCLNGHTLKAPANGRVFAVNSAVLDITDCTDTGVVQGGKVNFSTILVQGENGGILSIYGGTVKGGESAGSFGGNIAVVSGTVNIYGGTVEGGKTAHQGGAIYVAADQKLNIQGGTITSGEAAEGDCVYINQGAKVTVSGAPKIQELFLCADTTITQSVTENAEIGIFMERAGVFADGNEAQAEAFTSLVENCEVVCTGDKLALVSAHSHCFCDGSLSHTCEDVYMGMLTQADFDNATADSYGVSKNGSNYVLRGNFALAEDITFSGQILVYETVNLCLNDHSIASSNNRVFAVTGGTLNITDCGTNGTVKGGKASTGGTMYIQGSGGAANGNLGTVNIYGGTIQGGTTTSAASGQGGNTYIIGGTLNVYGGKLTGGNALGQGGNVLVAAGQNANFYGGELTSGTAAWGNGLYVVKGANVKLDGDPKISEIYLSDAKLTIGTLAEGFTTKLTASVSGVFAQNVQQDYSGCFETAGVAVTYDAETKTLTYGEAVGHKDHCICAGTQSHTCTTLAWTALTQADFDNATTSSSPVKKNGSNFNIVAGNYYLDGDIDLPGQLVVTADINLCLNGNDLKAPAANRIMAINGKTVNITDCGTDGQLVSGKASSGAGIFIQLSGRLNLYAGTIVGGEATGTYGGTVAINSGSMAMYGGTVTGGSAKTVGGTVMVNSSCTMEIYGGSITAGTAGEGRGACVYVAATGSVTVGGTPVIEEIFLQGSKLKVSETVKLQDNAQIGLNMFASTDSVVAESISYDPTSWIRSVKTGFQAVYDAVNGNLSLVAQE